MAVISGVLGLSWRLAIKPNLISHSDCGGLPPDSFTDWNDESNFTWNCGETKPVLRFRTRATFLACWGDLPRYTPILERSFHLWKICALDCRASYNTFSFQEYLTYPDAEL